VVGRMPWRWYRCPFTEVLGRMAASAVVAECDARPIPPGAAGDTLVEPAPRTTACTSIVHTGGVRDSSCSAAVAIGSKTCLSTSDPSTRHR
jgi:hypothetical protein